MDVVALAAIAQIVEAATVVAGVVFGLYQLSETRQQRRDAVAGELVRSFMDSDMTRSSCLVRGLPDGVSVEELRQAGPDAELAALRICFILETVGLLVHRRIAPLDLVVDLMGGMIVVMWRKLSPWVKQVRAENAQPSWAEWFEWLAGQCARHKNEGVPAYLAQRDWKP